MSDPHGIAQEQRRFLAPRFLNARRTIAEAIRYACAEAGASRF